MLNLKKYKVFVKTKTKELSTAKLLLLFIVNNRALYNWNKSHESWVSNVKQLFKECTIEYLFENPNETMCIEFSVKTV